MSDLKQLYDRVTTAQATIETVKNQIADALALGTPEGDEQALALESTLDSSIADEAKWHAFYDKLVNSSKGQNALQKFIPLTQTEIPVEDEDNTKVKAMNRADFEKMAPIARMDFIRGGGQITD